jgi:hypothetical protein
MLDDEIRIASLRKNRIEITGGLVDANVGVLNAWAVTILLALVDVGLSERDLVPKSMEVLVNTSIVGCGSIPVTRS